MSLWRALLTLCLLVSFASFQAPSLAEAKRTRKKKRKKRKRKAKAASPKPTAPTPADVAKSGKSVQEARKAALQALLKRELIIGTKVAPPFAIKNPDGTWRGISIELWQEIAAALKVKYKFKEYDLKGLLKNVKEGKIDAAVAALTITNQREAVFDFSHPFHITGFGIAVLPGSGKGWLGAAKQFFSFRFIQFLLALFAVLLLTGFVVWFFERRKNPEEFGGSAIEGIGAGVWWSAVTMTTVGYGDKSPRSFGGRLVAMVWIFASLILVSSFTAALTSILTVNRLESNIKGPRDLYRVRVASVEGSTSLAYLRKSKINVRAYPTVIDGMRDVATKKIDAMVYDAPILKYISQQNLQGSVAVLPNVFQRQDYGIAMPDGSPLREELNRAMLRIIYSPKWQGILQRYLGKSF